MKTVFTTLSVIFGVIFSHSVLAQDVTIYYTNDIHAHVNPAKIIAVDKNRLIGGMANISGIVNEAKMCFSLMQATILPGRISAP